MNKTWRFYDALTGVFQPGSFSTSVEADLLANTPAGHVAVDIEADPHAQRMDVATGQLVPYTPPPRVVVLDEAEARERRDALLAACDWVTLRAFETGQPIPPAWLAYRAALRDVTEQPGFPASITWPTPPAA